MLLRWEEVEGNGMNMGKQRGEEESAGVGGLDTFALLEPPVRKLPRGSWVQLPWMSSF